MNLPPAVDGFPAACRQHKITPTRYVFCVNVAEQSAVLLARGMRTSRQAPDTYSLVQPYRCSTSKFGIGQVSGSNCTPLGLHRIANKIGGGCPAGTVFKGRKPVGFIGQGLPLTSITTRILWLEGLEPGFNRGGEVDSHARFIYIHGTGDEQTIGQPASHGCVHLAAEDLIPLYDRLPVGTLVWISER